MKNITYLIAIIAVPILTGCGKEFLDSKPSSDIVQPHTLSDFLAIMENNNVVTYNTGGLQQLASDEYYYLNYEGWQNGLSATERQTYIWAEDTYGGDATSQDWNIPYKAVYYANNVIEGLNQLTDSVNSAEYDFIKGWAHFCRAYAMFELVKTYSPAYDSATSSSDLGIPLKLKSGIDNIEQRATLQESFDQIFSDCQEAKDLLPSSYPTGHLNHPSKIAAFALLARMYLYIRDYDRAGKYADSSLLLYNTLVDYNTVSQTSTKPFGNDGAESIYTSVQIVYYGATTVNLNLQQISVDTSLLALYTSNDLRKPIFFKSGLFSNSIIMKRGYMGIGVYPYTGLAVDEMYLVRAECYVRKGNKTAALEDLNTLLANRCVTGTYVPLTVGNTPNILDKVLEERRKELVWRGIRWSDLKRLNKEGANITLTRVLNGQTYTLSPNAPRYVFNIPQDEIALSGITQNER